MTTPSQYTTSYADSFRDRRKFISPTTDQPMHHFPGSYDKSHYGLHGSNGNNARTAMGNAHNSGNGGVAVQYQNTTQATSSGSFATSSHASVNSASIPNAIANPEGFGMYFPKAIPGGKDLWNHNPNSTHGGIAPITGIYGPSSLHYEGKSNYNSATSTASSMSGSFGGYNATTNTGSLGEDARPKYHIPGYSGHIRGERNRFGDTYGKQSRMSLDVPTDTPLEP